MPPNVGSLTLSMDKCDEDNTPSEAHRHEGGTCSPADHTNKSCGSIFSYEDTTYPLAADGDCSVEAVTLHNDGHNETTPSPVNDACITDGGIYETGPKMVSMRAPNDHGKKPNSTKDSDKKSLGDDAREGSIVATSAKSIEV